MKHSELTYSIIGLAYEVHRSLGAGLLESTYQKCLSYELERKGYFIQTEFFLPIEYKGMVIDHAYKADIVVERKVVLELKSVEALNNVHISQVLTYMKFGGYQVGLLLNFYCTDLKEGIRRLVL